MAINWYPERPKRVFALMEEVTPEELGAATLVRALVMSSGDKLRDDDRYIAGHLRQDIRAWRRIKRQLIQIGEIRVEGDFLRCQGGGEMVADITARIEQKVMAGVKSGVSRRRKLNAAARENNDIGRTAVQTHSLTDARNTYSNSLSPTERETVACESSTEQAPRPGVPLESTPVWQQLVDRIGFGGARLLKTARYEAGPSPRLQVISAKMAETVEEKFGLILREHLGSSLAIEPHDGVLKIDQNFNGTGI